jgi:hypothetical protein
MSMQPAIAMSVRCLRHMKAAARLTAVEPDRRLRNDDPQSLAKP